MGLYPNRGKKFRGEALQIKLGIILGTTLGTAAGETREETRAKLLDRVPKVPNT